MFRCCSWAALAAASILSSSASQLVAADLGGDCCLELEEVLPILEGTLPRKGNVRVHLTVSGFVTPTLTIGKGSYSLFLPGFVSVDSPSLGLPIAVQGTQVAVVDTTPFNHEDWAHRSVLQSVDRAVSNALDGSAQCIGGGQSEPSVMCRRSGAWAAGLGGDREIDETSSGFAADQTLIGGLAGIHVASGEEIVFGAFGGFASVKLENDFRAGEADTAFGLAGLYARVQSGQLTADVSMTGAWSQTDTVRNILSNLGGPIGFETAIGQHSGIIVSPTLALSWALPTRSATTIIPALKMRAFVGEYDGYAESGSSADFAPDGRSVFDVEARAELGLRHVFAGNGEMRSAVRARLGLITLQTFGDDSVGGTLLGQRIAFDTDTPNSDFGGYAGLGIDIPLTSSTAVFADSEFQLTGDSRAIFGFGGLRSRF